MPAPVFFQKVLIYGSLVIKNRAPAQIGSIFKLAVDVSRICRTYYVRDTKSKWSLARLIQKSFGSLVFHISLPSLIWKADAIYVLPSCNTEMGPLAFWNRIFKKPVIIDYYVSVFEWSCLMFNNHHPDSKTGRNYLRWDRLAFEADHVIHCNRIEWYHIADVLGFPKRDKEFYCVQLGTDFHKNVRQVKSPPRGEKTIFGWWGSSMPLHGLEIIIEGFEKLAERHCDFELHLLFLDEPRKKDYEKRAGAIPNHPWLISSIGITSSDGKLQNYINDRINIGFSHFGRGENCEYVYTNKVIESMSLGRTCLVADCPGNYEYADDLETYFYLCEASAEGIAAAAEKAITNPSLRLEKEANCEALFKEKFSTDAVAVHFEETLKTIYQSHQQSRKTA
jgi:glycosyltransferase involved in cell wall biosynthesis